MTELLQGVSGIVLAGGRSTRMGRDKAELVLKGESLLARTVSTLRTLSDDVLVVGRTAVPGYMCDVTMIPDELTDIGPLSGLASGLRRVTHRHAIVVACDLPFLLASVLANLASLAGDWDAAVPVIGGRAQPLHAIYRRDTVAAIDSLLHQGHRAMHSLLREIQVRWVAEEEIRGLDPEFRSFVNVNSADDWARVLGPLNNA